MSTILRLGVDENDEMIADAVIHPTVFADAKLTLADLFG